MNIDREKEMAHISRDSLTLAWKIRRHAIEMTHISHASHVASALSAADILAVLYSEILQVDPSKMQDPDRDRFVLSKGHAGVALYAALAETGFFPVEELSHYYADGSIFCGHVSHMVPGVEVSTGSLGHGIAVACGMAMAAKRTHCPYRVYTLTGDGECDEGIVWETALAANQYCLDNFTVIIDRNNMQALGQSENIIQLEPLADKWRSFGWEVIEVADGNDHVQLRKALTAPFNGKPKCIIARTKKGKGVSFMENDLLWHYRDPQGEFYDRAIEELEANCLCEMQ